MFLNDYDEFVKDIQFQNFMIIYILGYYEFMFVRG